jgi:ABC-2 type transport system permease protein
MTAIRFGLRLGRWGLVVFSLGGFFATLVNAIAFYQVAGHTQAEREAFARSFAQIAAQLTVLLPPPIRLDTMAGYVQFRGYGSLAILFAIWALAAATGAARADEDRGIVEMVLATGLSRMRAIVARVAAFAFASLVASLAASFGLILGAIAGRESFPIGPALEVAVLLAAITICSYCVVLLIAQLAAARFATGLAGAVLLGLFLLNSLSRTFDWLDTPRWLSPFRYYELSQPLPPGGNFDVLATLVLFGIAVVAAALAALAFMRRDLGSALFPLGPSARPPSYEVSRTLIWRIPVLRGVYDRRVGLVVWTIGVSVVAALFVVLTKTMVQPLLAIPGLAAYFAAFVHGGVYSSFLAFIWFGFAQLLLAGFAITQVARWSAEDSDGRLEMILSNPVSRTRVLLERAIVLAVGASVIAAASGLAVGVEAHYQAIGVDSRRLAEASALLVPFTLVIGAVGGLLVARIPRGTVGILGVYVFLSYLMLQFGPIFNFPAWVQNLSAFKLYGQPLTDGVDLTGLAIMIAIVLVGFGVSVAAMRRRDVGA